MITIIISAYPSYERREGDGTILSGENLGNSESDITSSKTSFHRVSDIDTTTKVITFTPEITCLLYTSPSPRDRQKSRMPSSA